MKIYINNLHQIKAVNENTTGDNTLKEIEVEDNFLEGWCDTVKCAFCYHEWVDDDGHQCLSVYPYKDFAVMESIQREHDNTSQQILAAATPPELMLAARFLATTFTDEQAIQVPTLYLEFTEVPEGTTLYDGKDGVHPVDRLRYNGTLYKVISTHQKQSTWTPDTAASLYTPIGEPDEGTKENPIIWKSGMESEKGKYYLDEGVLYVGLEDSGIGLYGQPKDLARYFKEVEVQ